MYCIQTVENENETKNENKTTRFALYSIYFSFILFIIFALNFMCFF